MEPRFVIIMNFSTGELIRIRLTDEELRESERFEDFSDYLKTLEGKYGFRVKDCLFMTTETLSERSLNI